MHIDQYHRKKNKESLDQYQKRIEKETASYVKEAEKQKEKIAKLEAENGEQAYINKQKQVLQEQ